MFSFLIKTILFAIFILFSACENCVFVSKNSSLLVLTFTETNDQQKTIDSNLYFDSIKSSVGNLMYPTTNKTNFGKNFVKLQVNPAAQNATFLFYSEGTKKVIDTLTISYSRQISIITPDCGFDEQIDLIEIIKTTFKEKNSENIAKSKILINTLLIGDDNNLRKNIEISR